MRIVLPHSLSYIKYPIILGLLCFSHLGKSYFKDNSEDTVKDIENNYKQTMKPQFTIFFCVLATKTRGFSIAFTKLDGRGNAC